MPNYLAIASAPACDQTSTSENSATWNIDYTRRVSFVYTPVEALWWSTGVSFLITPQLSYQVKSYLFMVAYSFALFFHVWFDNWDRDKKLFWSWTFHSFFCGRKSRRFSCFCKFIKTMKLYKWLNCFYGAWNGEI